MPEADTLSLPTLERFGRQLEESSLLRWEGKVIQANGYMVESEGPFCSVGECCQIEGQDGQSATGEIIGFHGSTVLSMPLAETHGIRYGDRIVTWGDYPRVPAGDGLIGRVIDAEGNPIDGLGGFSASERRRVDAGCPTPMSREPISEPIGCGVRAIDAMITCGRGQRMGIFGGSGVGKSTLTGMMARGTTADLTVVALIGERGREVREFLEDALGEEGRRRSVVVVSTSDQSPLLRLRAARTAHAVAEHFCARGKNVLMVLDSITRFAMAQREVGLAAGEPPTSKGYTPSVFRMLAQLVERTGNMGTGSITAFYSVLMEGDDLMDPIVDSVRSLLDGHIMLDRRLTSEGHFPAINILESLSRLMPAITTPEHMAAATAIRKHMAIYTRNEDLIRIGAYQKGSDAELDAAIAAMPAIRAFLQQKSHEIPAMADTVASLRELVTK
jgi:flagellum-specific ATP synthase